MNFKNMRFENWRNVRFENWQSVLTGYLWITLAALLDALAVVVFLAPFNIAPAGVAGLSVIMNRSLGTPIGLMVLLINIPIQLLAYRMLPGGWKVVVRTVYVIVIFSAALDLMSELPIVMDGVGNDALLNTLFGGILGGIAGGMVYRAGGSLGGTSTLALILQRRLGTPMSTTFLYTDTLVIGLAGLVFGWEKALLAMVALFVGAVATDYVMEGPSVIRTCVIITDKPEEISQAIMNTMFRGVTAWKVTGMYTGEPHSLLYVTVSRTQVHELRALVTTVDPDVFMVIGHGHTAYGEGFRQVGGS